MSTALILVRQIVAVAMLLHSNLYSYAFNYLPVPFAIQSYDSAERNIFILCNAIVTSLYDNQSILHRCETITCIQFNEIPVKETINYV